MRVLFPRKRRAKLALFDWSNVVARAYFAGRDGKYLQLLCRMLLNYRKSLKSFKFVFCMEGKGTEIRREIYPKYKAGRGGQERPPELLYGTMMLLKYLNCHVVRAKKGEADDAIAAYLNRRKEEISKAMIISEDRDLWQLIGPRVHALTRKGEVSSNECKTLMSVLPENVLMHKALLGDSSDGLPRTPKIRTKMLIRISQECRTLNELSELLENSDWLPKEAKKLLYDNQEQINCNYQVARLRSDLPLQIKVVPGNPKGLLDFLIKNRVYSLTIDDATLIAGAKE